MLKTLKLETIIEFIWSWTAPIAPLYLHKLVSVFSVTPETLEVREMLMVGLPLSADPLELRT
jgi:hypothetical protein